MHMFQKYHFWVVLSYFIGDITFPSSIQTNNARINNGYFKVPVVVTMAAKFLALAFSNMNTFLTSFVTDFL